MLNCQKEKFFIAQDVTYLNGAYMSPQLRQVEEVGIQAVQRKNKPWTITPADFFKEVEALKLLFARLVHTDQPERIAVIPSVSYGIANAARNISFEKGDHILILEKQFPSNYYEWVDLARKKELVLDVVKAPDSLVDRGQAWNQKVMENIKPRTRVVAMENVHWTDGTWFDVAQISKKIKAQGGFFIVDATQSLGIFDFDQNLVQADAVIATGYKWLLGPYAIGCAYYGPAFDQGEPLEENWINKQYSQEFERILDYEESYRPGAARYGMGEQSQFVQVPMLCASLSQILEWGVAEMQAYCRGLVDQVLPLLDQKDLWIEKKDWRASHLFGLRTAGGFSPAVKQKLLDQKIFVSYRDDAIRVSPNVYNTKEDLIKLIETLRSAH
ncbi:MAG TPA: aminotransferase class V-fold PLP-dependent enzyme [Saprospiraceae bacterium]|nr:aminotransferase class V-fold PLP-dependent enzyme [Saprospiraceae bacterium]HNT19886.1 aminotransferase class V-fold PLP-dependent enzyme [Saprospiraceae bacterium]